MGRVMTKLKLTNPIDMELAAVGKLPKHRVRTVTVDALVDTGASTLVLPEDVVRALGVRRRRHRERVHLADGRLREVQWTRGIEIEILGRTMTCDALVFPKGSTPLIGQIPLEQLCLLVDPRSREVRIDPDNPDGILEVLGVA
jgi:clan AA aspartic protease